MQNSRNLHTELPRIELKPGTNQVFSVASTIKRPSEYEQTEEIKDNSNETVKRGTAVLGFPAVGSQYIRNSASRCSSTC